MATITIRQLDDAVKKRLRVRAARHGRSMEAEAPEILKVGVATSEREPDRAESIRALFEPLGELIVLDTNIASEVMRASLAVQVTKWRAFHAHSMVLKSCRMAESPGPLQSCCVV